MLNRIPFSSTQFHPLSAQPTGQAAGQTQELGRTPGSGTHHLVMVSMGRGAASRLLRGQSANEMRFYEEGRTASLRPTMDFILNGEVSDFLRKKGFGRLVDEARSCNANPRISMLKHEKLIVVPLISPMSLKSLKKPMMTSAIFLKK